MRALERVPENQLAPRKHDTRPLSLKTIPMSHGSGSTSQLRFTRFIIVLPVLSWRSSGLGKRLELQLPSLGNQERGSP